MSSIVFKKLFLLILFTEVMIFSFSVGVGLAAADEIIRVTDSDGFEVEIKCPVERIVCISASLSELLLALGVEDKIIAREEWNNIPDSLKSLEGLPVVASSSFSPNIEAVVELNPDLVIADTMLQEDARRKFEAFGIPAVGEETSNASDLFNIINRLALIFEKEEKSKEIIEFIAGYRNIIKERTAHLSEDKKIRVYWEWLNKYQSGSLESIIQPRIELAGGINICADTEVIYPQVSSEYVIQENPEVIIRMENGGISPDKMKKVRQELMNRPGLDKTSAVKNERVYITTWASNMGIQSVVGDLYYAKFAHPDLFEDIDPGQVYIEIMDRFFGVEYSDDVVLVFPEE